MTGTPANWGGTVPTATDVARWNAATYTTAPTANANMSIGELWFASGNTGGVTFGAGTGTLTLNGVSGVGIQMDSGSGAASTGSAMVALGASQTWLNNSASTLTVGNTISNADSSTAKTLTIAGSGNTSIINNNGAGIVDNGAGGTLAITKNGSGTMSLGQSSNNAFTGGLTLNSGTIAFQNSQPFGAGTVTVNGGNFSVIPSAGTLTTTGVTSWALNADLNFAASAGGAWNTGTAGVTLGAANIAINNLTAAGFTVGGTITGTSNLTLNLNSTGSTTLTSANSTGTITILNSNNANAPAATITTVGSNVTAVTMSSANGGGVTTTLSNVVVNSGGTTLSNNMTAGTGRALLIGNTSGTGDLTINNNATVGSTMVQTTGTATALGSINHTGNLTYGGTGNATWSVINMNIGSNVVNVSKSHSAQVNLAGVNTYTGSTTVSSGVLALTGNFSSGGNYIANTGGTMYVDFGTGLATGSGNQANKINTAATLQLGGGILSVNAAPNKAAVANTAWTSITTTGLPAGQVQLNFGTAPAVTVGQPITATGISAGSYVVRISGTNVIVASSTTPAATGTDFAAAATTTTRTSQTFGGTTLNAGASTIKAAADSGAGSGTAINIGAITRNVGSTLLFTNPTGTLSATNSIQTSTGSANTILTDSNVAYATISTTDWAAKDSTGTFVTAVGNATYTTAAYTAATTTALAGNADLSVASQNTTLAAGASITSLRFSQASAHTITVSSGNLTTGGILVSSAITTQAQTITGGNLMSAGAGKDLPVIVNSTTGGLTINSAIVDNTSATGLTLSGTGFLALTGPNTYTGATTINSGATLQLAKTQALYTGNPANWTASKIKVGSAGTLALNVGGTGEFSTGNVTTLLTNLGGANGGTSGGFAGGSIIGFDTTNAAGSTFTVADLIANSSATGGGAIGLTKLGTNTLILTNANTFTGNLSIAGNGAVSLSTIGNQGVASNAGAGTSITLGGAGGTAGTLVYTGTGSTTDRNIIFGGGVLGSNPTFDQSGTGLLKFTGNTSFSSTNTVKTITLQGSTAGTGEFAGNIVENTGGSPVTNLTKSGTGTWTLSGNNSYNGTTTVSAGTLQFAKTQALYTGNQTNWTASKIKVSSAGTLALNVGGTGEFSTGNVTTLLTNLGGANGGTSGGFASGSIIGFDTTNAGSTFTVADLIANSSGTGGGAIGLTKLGTNTLILTNANTFTGNLTILGGGAVSLATIGDQGVASNAGAGTAINLGGSSSSGTLIYTGTATTTNRTIAMTGGTLGSNVIIDQSGTGLLKFTSNVTNGSSNIAKTLTLQGSTAGTGEIAGNIQEGAGGMVTSLIKSGTGTWTLSGNNTYSGTTSISAGTLQVDGSTGANSQVNVGTAGTLTGAGTINGNATLTGGGTINKSAGTIAGTLAVTGGNWNGNGTVTGAVTSSGGTFMIGSGANLTANGGMNVTGGTLLAGAATSTITGNVSYTSSTNSTFSGVFAGSGKTITMNATGSTLTLSGNNTYTGATTVSGGTLQASAANALGSTSGITVNTGGTLLVSANASIGPSTPITMNSTAAGNGTAAALVFNSSYNGTVGALVLTTNSIFDLGSDPTGVQVHFSSINLNGNTLSIYNWTGTTLWEGGTGNNLDQIYAGNRLSDSDLAHISFYSGLDASSFRGNGYQIMSGSFINELGPVPEPSTWVAMAALILTGGIIGLRRRGRGQREIL